MKKLAVLDDFFSGEQLDRIRSAAARHGFAADYYPDGDLPLERAAEYEILYGYCDPAVLRAAARLKWFCCSFAGVDRFLSDDVYAHAGVLLSNSSGVFGIAISEHVLMVALMLLRNMPAFLESAREHRFAAALPMRSICGCSITVLGTGDIGAAFARRAKALSAGVVRGVNRSGRTDDPAFDAAYPIDELDGLLPQTELLVMALPQTPSTVNTLSRARIALLPQEAIVINVGRGTAVDQDALAEALNEGRIAGAALDVMTPEPLPPEHPLWNTKNLLITPHISGNMSIAVTREKNVVQFLEDLENYAAGRPLARLVDRKRGY